MREWGGRERQRQTDRHAGRQADRQTEIYGRADRQDSGEISQRYRYIIIRSNTD